MIGFIASLKISTLNCFTDKTLERAMMLMEYKDHDGNASEASRNFLRSAHRISLNSSNVISLWKRCTVD